MDNMESQQLDQLLSQFIQEEYLLLSERFQFVRWSNKSMQERFPTNK